MASLRNIHSLCTFGLAFATGAAACAVTTVATIAAIGAQSKAFAQAPVAKETVSKTVTRSADFRPTSIDGVLVTVAEDVVLYSDLQRAVRAASSGQTSLQSGGKLQGGALTAADAEQLLEQIINQKVLGLRVKEMGIDVGEDELEQEIETFLKQQNVTRDVFEKELAKEGETVESHREEFRNQLETQRFIGRVIRPLVSVTDDEVRNFYLQQAGAQNSSEKVKLRSIVVNLEAGLTEVQRQSKQERINRVRKEADSGVDFSTLAKSYSESPDVLKTEGLLPPRKAGELPKELQEKLKTAKPSDVIGPLEIGSSVFFFQFLGFETSGGDGFESQKAQWENKLLEIKFRERLDEYVKAERTKVKINRRPLQLR